VNYQIAHDETEIDDDIMKQIEEGKRDDVEIRDFEELVEELGIGG